MARLNPAQAAAVEHERGPLLVLAGAGSGKTRVITQRIARLVERGARPEQILAVSFTNKAAAEMAERLHPLLGKERTEKVWLSTFHSFGVRFLREESKALGFGRFVIFDQSDSLGVVRDILKRDHPGDRKLDQMAILTRISLWKNAFKMPEDVPASDFEYDAVAREVYPAYEKALANMHAVDFDDLVVKPVSVLRRREDLRDKWRARFRHLLIDEFQDTNVSQLELIKLLANEEANVCVVGDDDQSIYGWRGADVGNILDFERHFQGAEVVKLEDNYRSYAPILEVANAAIARSRTKRHDKRLRAARGPGEKVRMVAVEDAAAQAKLVASEIRELRKEGKNYKDMAVLYRSNQLARLLEEELRAADVPYRVYGGTQFFDRKVIKDVVAYLRVAVNPRDELSLRRVINYPPRGIGDTAVERLSAHASLKGITLMEALSGADQIDNLSASARRGCRGLLAALGNARRGFASGHLTDTVRELVSDVGIEARLHEDQSAASRRSRDNLQFLLRSIDRFEKQEKGERGSLQSFLNRITLRIDNEGDGDAGNRVTLSSLHSSKGLEFDTVFLIGCVEGQLPHSRTTDPKVTEAAPTDVDEERRLFYVGVTRARDRLFLVRPKQRVHRGKVVPLTPSRFLDGLPEEHVEHYEPVGEQEMDTDEIAAMAEALLAKLGA